MNAEWINVKDKLPEETGKYLIHRLNKKSSILIEFFQKARFHNSPTCFFHPNGIEDEYVTHWMLLPESPDKDK